MRHSRTIMALGLALALLGAGTAPGPAHAARASLASAAGSTRKAAALHQFTGVVTALDKSSLTVEKSGKAPRSVTFTRHPEMTSTGTVEKNARVTVYYRDEDGHAVAHRVVVKADPSETASK